MNLNITHLMRRDPMQGVLVPMSFVTRDEDGEYHLATERRIVLSAEAIAEAEGGLLIPLPEPVPYVADHIVWLCPDGTVWLAPPTEPFDESRTLVYRDEAVVEAEQ